MEKSFSDIASFCAEATSVTKLVKTEFLHLIGGGESPQDDTDIVPISQACIDLTH